MKIVATFLCLLLIPTIAYNAAPLEGVRHVKLSDFGGVKHVKLSDFLKPTPAPEVAAPDPFYTLYQQAVASRQPLYVWIDYRCPSSANQAGGLHFHAPGTRWRDVQGPAVVVLKPLAAAGWLGREKVVLARDCCAAALTSGLSAELQPASRAAGRG